MKNNSKSRRRANSYGWKGSLCMMRKRRKYKSKIERWLGWGKVSIGQTSRSMFILKLGHNSEHLVPQSLKARKDNELRDNINSTTLINSTIPKPSKIRWKSTNSTSWWNTNSWAYHPIDVHSTAIATNPICSTIISNTLLSPTKHTPKSPTAADPTKLSE